MIWAARILIVALKTIAEARRGRVTQQDVDEITWWLLMGQSREEWEHATP